jgi:hypothetical protein
MHQSPGGEGRRIRTNLHAFSHWSGTTGVELSVYIHGTGKTPTHITGCKYLFVFVAGIFSKTKTQCLQSMSYWHPLGHGEGVPIYLYGDFVPSFARDHLDNRIGAG